MPDILSLNQLVAERVREYPSLPVLAIPDKNFHYTRYTTTELDEAASLLAHHLKDTGALLGRAMGDATSRLTVGLLGVSNIDYVVTLMALYRMGYCVAYLSPNNSPAAIAHLLTVTNASHVVVQEPLLASAIAALARLPDPSSVSIVRQPPSSVFGPDVRATRPEKTRWEPRLSPDEECHLPIAILHSSGSTGFPKPITVTNKVVIKNCGMNFGLTSLTTLPLFHNFGHTSLFRAWYTAKLLYLFPSASIPLTSANTIKLLSQGPDIEGFFGVPFALKLLAETQEGLQALKRLKLVLFTGSACPEELGDFLVANGIPLVGHYGLTEMGVLMTSFRDFDTDKEWNWMRTRGPYVTSRVHEYVRFEHIGDDAYELYVLDGWPIKVMSNQPDGSYATKDVFVKHPTIPGAYKYVGRIDDTLVMVNGEKTNPVPIELALRSSPFVTDAVVFGAGRTQIGALVLPSEAAQHLSREELVRRVAPVVARANADAPSHSQLSTEALVVLPYGAPIPKTDKGSVLRAKTYKAFEKEIEGLYRRLEGEVTEPGERRRAVEGETEARTLVRELIANTIDGPVDGLGDDTDLFEFGLDSLQSTRIRNAIQREIDLDGKKLSINAVFEHPSITKLARLILLCSTGKLADAVPPQKDPREVMLQLVEKYSHFSYSPYTDGTNGVDIDSRKVVVLTGATGSLGAHILDELLADPQVETVYCLCRASDDADAANRVEASLFTRKLSKHIKPHERVKAFAADLAAVRLGLDEERYAEIATRATVVIHNAWAVNFNLGISSFETHVRGAANLMQLALSSPHSEPARFFFASSISAVLNWPGPGLVPEAVADNPAFAQDTGYAQSKWVTEKLCQIAARKTPMRTAILRIGQMVGDTTNGIWNESEGVSLIIKCADTIGVLPELDEQVSWLPVDYAAKSIVELVDLPASAAECPVYHVLHPARVPWSFILDSLRLAHVRFERVPRHDWLTALRASDADERRNPSRKLLAFYEGKYGGEVERTKAELSVDDTARSSRWLREAPAIDAGLVAKWVGAWRERGFLHRP